MKNQINSVESILAVLGLELDDFFIVSFWKTSQEVHLQGHNSPELFSKVSKLENFGFTKKYYEEVNQYHFINSKIKFNILLS